jgi:hypothetical protein
MALLSGRRTAADALLRAAPRVDRRALACCVLAALGLVVGLALVLSRSERHRSGTNGVLTQAALVAPSGTQVCQGRELLPASTVALEIEGMTTAPPLVTVRRHGRMLGRAEAVVDRRAGVIRAPIERTPARTATSASASTCARRPRSAVA